jgi:N-acetylneuraminic acid mutarotase
MVYNNQFKKVIVFGGIDPESQSWSEAQMQAETWVYDPLVDNWTNMSPLTQPVKRFSHSMVYDSSSDKVLLFGGYDGTDNISPFRIDDTWIYDLSTNTWTEKSPSTKPSARDTHAMAYNSLSDRVILFGGYGDDSSLFGDTWVYDLFTNTWTNMSPLIQPSPRYSHSMVYHSLADKIILFGGTSDSSSSFGDTWAYDLSTNTWTSMNPSTSPTARFQHSMVYDSKSDKVILFGGRDEETYSKVLDDTWVYDLISNNWIQLYPTTSPNARSEHRMVYEPVSDKVVLFGGKMPLDAAFRDTWICDLVTTAEISIAPPSAPQSLSITSGENFVDLNWLAPLSDGGSAITYYRVYRGTTSGAYMFLGITNDTTYKDSTSIGGLTYYYVVTAVNAAGESNFSNETSGTPTGESGFSNETNGTTTGANIPISSPFPNILFLVGFLGFLVVFVRRK